MPTAAHVPMSQIDVAEAKRDLDQLLERASQGEEVVITQRRAVPWHGLPLQSPLLHGSSASLEASRERSG